MLPLDRSILGLVCLSDIKECLPLRQESLSEIPCLIVLPEVHLWSTIDRICNCTVLSKNLFAMSSFHLWNIFGWIFHDWLILISASVEYVHHACLVVFEIVNWIAPLSLWDEIKRILNLDGLLYWTSWSEALLMHRLSLTIFACKGTKTSFHSSFHEVGVSWTAEICVNEIVLDLNPHLLSL